MSFHPTMVSLSDDDLAFLTREVEAGKYADLSDAVRAALALARRSTPGNRSKSEFHQGHGVSGLQEAEPDIYSVSEYSDLKADLSLSEKSGVSARDIPSILQSVKAKMRANGSL